MESTIVIIIVINIVISIIYIIKISKQFFSLFGFSSSFLLLLDDEYTFNNVVVTIHWAEDRNTLEHLLKHK